MINFRTTHIIVLCFGVAACNAEFDTKEAPRAGKDVTKLAIAVLNDAQSASFASNTEYCGLIGYNANGILEATDPRQGKRDSCDFGETPQDWKVVAGYHTHGAYDRNVDGETPSMGDMEADFEEGIDGYIATPGGRIWHISVSDRIAKIVCGKDCVLSDPQYQDCKAFEPASSYTLTSLQARIDRDTGEC